MMFRVPRASPLNTVWNRSTSSIFALLKGPVREANTIRFVLLRYDSYRDASIISRKRECVPQSSMVETVTHMKRCITVVHQLNGMEISSSVKRVGSFWDGNVGMSQLGGTNRTATIRIIYLSNVRTVACCRTFPCASVDLHARNNNFDNRHGWRVDGTGV